MRAVAAARETAEAQLKRAGILHRQGRPAAVILPAQCLNQLLMTVPRMIETALRNSQGDKSLRYVHPMESFTLEVALQARGSLHRAIEGRQFQDRPDPHEFRDRIRSKTAVEFHILIRQSLGP